MTETTREAIRAFLIDTFGDEKPLNRAEAIEYLRDEYGGNIKMQDMLPLLKEMYGL